MTQLIMNVQSLNACDVAKRLREAADILERGEWDAIFLARLRAQYAVGILESFCSNAEQHGSAPSFADVLGYADAPR